MSYSISLSGRSKTSRASKSLSKIKGKKGTPTPFLFFVCWSFLHHTKTRKYSFAGSTGFFLKGSRLLGVSLLGGTPNRGYHNLTLEAKRSGVRKVGGSGQEGRVRQAMSGRFSRGKQSKAKRSEATQAKRRGPLIGGTPFKKTEKEKEQQIR